MACHKEIVEREKEKYKKLYSTRSIRNWIAKCKCESCVTLKEGRKRGMAIMDESKDKDDKNERSWSIWGKDTWKYVYRSFRFERAYPFPEVGEDGSWRVIDSQEVGVSRSEKKFYTPLTTSPVYRRLRSHEVGHIKWTPYELKEVIPDPNLLMACEDTRINTLIDRAEIDISPTMIEDPGLTAKFVMACDANEANLAAFYLSSLKTGDQDFIESTIERFRPELSGFLSDLENLYKRHVGSKERLPITDSTYPLAHDVRDLVQKYTSQKAQYTSLAQFALGYSEDVEGIFQPDPGNPNEEEEGRRSSPGDQDVGQSWGHMEINDIAKPIPFSLDLKVKPRYRATDEGIIPKRMQRFCTDLRIFNQPGKKAIGGSVLIDNSGSMSLSREEVLAIMEVFPAVIIACYAGGTRKGPTWGELRIIAHEGFRCEDENVTMMWNNNLIDGPALLWLAKQPGPRYWVSDGGVTGVGDLTNTRLRQYCRQICIKNNIKHVGNVRGLLRQKGYGIVQDLEHDQYEDYGSYHDGLTYGNLGV